jgi:hypothetical protein
MGNLAKSILNLSVEPQSGVLALADGNTPQTVYVTAINQGGASIAAFAVQDSGPFFTDGISWQHNNAGPLFVTLVFLVGAGSIQCDGLAYSPYVNGKQLLCIPAVGREYTFNILFSSGATPAVKIIVTPI